MEIAAGSPQAGGAAGDVEAADIAAEDHAGGLMGEGGHLGVTAVGAGVADGLAPEAERVVGSFGRGAEAVPAGERHRLPGGGRGGRPAQAVEDGVADQTLVAQAGGDRAGMRLARERVEGLAGAAGILADHRIVERACAAERLKGVGDGALVAVVAGAGELGGLGEAEGDAAGAIGERRRQEGEVGGDVGRSCSR